MMNAAFAALGIDARYEAWDTAPSALAARIGTLARLSDFRGANVTIPHKRAVLALCARVDPFANAIGAANVLVPERGTISAHNTDAPGALAALRDAGVSLAGASAVILGAGGAARAIAVGLAHAGAARVTLLARRPDAALSVVSAIAALGTRCEARALPLADTTLARDAFADASLAVQATSVGMALPGEPLTTTSPVLGAELLTRMRRGSAAMDLVYTPRETPWLACARALGLHAIDGLGMLAHQGALALALWFGIEPPAALLRRFLDGGAPCE